MLLGESKEIRFSPKIDKKMKYFIWSPAFGLTAMVVSEFEYCLYLVYDKLSYYEMFTISLHFFWTAGIELTKAVHRSQFYNLLTFVCDIYFLLTFPQFSINIQRSKNSSRLSNLWAC